MRSDTNAVGPERRPVLVTGAAGGIGRSVVATLADEGFDVWAAVRSESDAHHVRAEFGVDAISFDITDEEETREALAQISASGPLYGLVNVAGSALPGPLEHVPMEQLQRQLEVNVVGQLRVTQALVPALRSGACRWGRARIVMVGSLDARVVGPFFGPYAASKHALVGLSDALRAELVPDRIDVVLLEPGVVATPIWRRGTAVLADLQATLPDRGGHQQAMFDFAQRHAVRLSRHGAAPRRVAHAVARSLMSRSPAPRRVVGVDAAIASVALAVMPDRLINRLTALPAIWSARRSTPRRWTPAGPRRRTGTEGSRQPTQ